jgi:prepilin-type N-terminal cleavage/methylation domain-containing protein
MQTTRTKSTRQAFTLVELLVVIAIIAVLAALLLSGVMRFISQGDVVTARSEITNLEGAMAQFKQEFGVDHIPSDFVLHEDQYDTSQLDQRKAVGYLTTLFGKNLFKQPMGTPANIVYVNVDWNSDGDRTDRVRLTGEQCLVFFLGGIQRNSGSGFDCLGFGKTPTDPSLNITNPATARVGPFFQFKTDRLTPGASGFLVYRDAYKRAPTDPQAAYAYFAASRSGTYEAYSTSAFYYVDGTGKPINPNGYQILCAGADGRFGSIPGTPGTWTESAGTVVENGKDDQANFASGLLKASK